jgi:hypothetical protein
MSIANEEAVASQTEEQQSSAIDQKPAEPDALQEDAEVEAKTGDDEIKPDAEAKPTETTEERERIRLERALERNKREKREARAELHRLREENARLTKPIAPVNNEGADDSEPLSLSRAQLDALIDQRANEIAPTIAQQRATEQQIHEAAIAVREALGEDDFEDLTSDIGNVFPANKQLALLQAEKPAELIRYLADPENSKEARQLSGMPDFQFGIAVARLQDKIAAKPAKPEASKAPEPLSNIRQSAPANDPAPKDSDSMETWIKKENARLNKLRGLPA